MNANLEQAFAIDPILMLKALSVLLDKRFTAPADAKQKREIAEFGGRLLHAILEDRTEDLGKIIVLQLGSKQRSGISGQTSTFALLRLAIECFSRAVMEKNRFLWDGSTVRQLELAEARKPPLKKSGGDRVGRFETELTDEFRHLAIMRLVKHSQMTKADAMAMLHNADELGLAEATLDAAYKRHTRRARQHGFLYFHEQVLCGILPTSGIEMEDLPSPGRPRKK